MAGRLEMMGQEKYVGTTRLSGKRRVWTGKVVLDRNALLVPYGWRKGRRVFVNSMSDLFHEAVPLDFIQEVFAVMRETPRHIFQILTKRADRLLELSSSLDWTKNIWMGVSVESDDVLWRADCLRKTAARTKFLSCEPLLGPMSALEPSGIDWVIAGGESGPGARAMEVEWIREIRDICLENNVAFHFKQWGGPVKSKTGRVLDGRTWDEMPSPHLFPINE
jgi:protein gp37